MNKAKASVLCTTAFKAVLDELTPEIERLSGVTFMPVYGAAPRLVELAMGGEPSDAVLTNSEAIDSLVAKGAADKSSRVDVARAEIAVAVPRGAPHPELRTVKDFEKALLTSRGVALSNPVGKGFSAIHLQLVLKKLDLSDRLKSKIVYSSGGPTGMVGFLVANGQADIGIQLKPELMAVTGIEVVGPLPQPLAGATMFALAGATRATNPGVIRLLTDLLHTSGLPIMRRLGFEPA